jgi:xanthine dehydrogenase accessory factor
MTKEIRDIIAAYEKAREAGRQTALATVVHVEGSSYRRPGARMLVEDNGKITGAISGGCLEGDALRKALLAISQHQNKLVTYDTESDDDVAFGVQLGCNGIVHILFEPINGEEENNPIILLQKAFLQRRNAVVITLFSLKNKYGQQPGTCSLFDGDSWYSRIADDGLQAQLKDDAAQALHNKSSLLKAYQIDALTGFVELVKPPVSLVIAGAGNDAFPLVEMAGILGWQTTVVDGRPAYASVQRFPGADKVIVAKPPEVAETVLIDEQTVFLLMTHNYNYDKELLARLLKKGCSYIGTLGPKKRLVRMLTELREEGNEITTQQEEVIYGPTGLDIGAEASEEIALSVLAEIKAVLTKRQGGFLRERAEGIHSRAAMEKDA